MEMTPREFAWYLKWLLDHGTSIEDLALRIEKPVSWIQERLELLNANIVKERP
jgi:hypothetical protein